MKNLLVYNLNFSTIRDTKKKKKERERGRERERNAKPREKLFNRIKGIICRKEIQTATK